ITHWAYDPDGLPIKVTTPGGDEVRYLYDARGYVAQVDHTSFGVIRYVHDADGHLVRADSPTSTHTWGYSNGFISHHQLNGDGETSTTAITRGANGLIRSIERDCVITTYAYDQGCQLTHAQGTHGSHEWVYDSSGRLVSHAAPGGSIHWFSYDQASQLVVHQHNGQTTRFTYDESGRRIGRHGEGSILEYDWDGRGWLRTITTDHGDSTAHTEFWVNALGELGSVDDSVLTWNYATTTPELLSVGDAPVFVTPGGVGVGDKWVDSTWRIMRANQDGNPWSVLSTHQAVSPTNPVGVSPVGGVHVGEMEWMGARIYDPATHAFLTVDPLEPLIGAVWAGNPYAFAGNNPLHALDPLGLRPVSDEELQAYNDCNQGALAKARDWVGNNWEYIAGGAMIAVGVGLMLTGIGGPVGAVVMGAASGAFTAGGTSVISQKFSDGEVDWGKVAQEALIGG
ncbi:MAG TPA: RHS repeat-associated core domain-containing protein, partial [Beutenbergiaceae bacterium]|nr:RHS repeat-associated core domain-containing protein [Beutenbergiaceae bacterium]